jgi:hypothetical protein
MGISINTGLNSAREAIGVIEALTEKTKNPIKTGFVFSRNFLKHNHHQYFFSF